ncbi:MAG: multiheme c-type cytochrome [Nitrospiraceae bacterium]|nr:multiheme c-type cytochrome [Nitrospiraceae bacterium]
MKRLQPIAFVILIVILSPAAATGSEKKTGLDRKPDQPAVGLSRQTRACISCHNSVTPGIVHDWLSSRHSRTTPAEALKKPSLQRRISAAAVDKSLSEYAVGCYECHSRNPERHKDNFEHMGFRINVVVSPNDCSACHPEEARQFAGSKKANAIANLMSNPVYHALVRTTTGVKKVVNGRIVAEEPTDDTLRETCLGCHGTDIAVRGMKKVSTKMGEISVPDLANWPNQGVGRKNPDGTLGACTACHPRHGFSIEVARKPYTCGQCHHEPDVPAWNVYEESKHGNIYSSREKNWNFDHVPWVVGADFSAPTCAVCHNSLLVSPAGDVIAERTHDFGSRLWVRLFGLIYSHPQPKSGDTTIIRNKDGLPLPTTFAGEPAAAFLIDRQEQDRRQRLIKAVCNGCHSSDWVNGHFLKLDSTIKETDAMIRAATELMADAWEKGIEDKTNPFDEAIEKLWVKQWLFYSNSIRYASAMTGAPDYTSFKLGWWELSDNLQRMKDAIEAKEKTRGPKQAQ